MVEINVEHLKSGQWVYATQSYTKYMLYFFLNNKAIFDNESKRMLKRFESWLEKVTKLQGSRDRKKAERKRKSEGR